MKALTILWYNYASVRGLRCGSAFLEAYSHKGLAALLLTSCSHVSGQVYCVSRNMVEMFPRRRISGEAEKEQARSPESAEEKHTGRTDHGSVATCPEGRRSSPGRRQRTRRFRVKKPFATRYDRRTRCRRRSRLVCAVSGLGRHQDRHEVRRDA